MTHSAIHKCSRNTAVYYRLKEFALQFVYSIRIYVLDALNAVIRRLAALHTCNGVMYKPLSL